MNTRSISLAINDKLPYRCAEPVPVSPGTRITTGFSPDPERRTFRSSLCVLCISVVNFPWVRDAKVPFGQSEQHLDEIGVG